MKPQVPDILVQLYKKIDPVADQQVVDTLYFPSVGTIYRDNTNGLVWKLLAYSGDDTYEPGCNANLGGSVSLKETKRPRDVLAILGSVDNAKLIMHIKPDVLESEIMSLDHYKVVMKDSPRV